MARSSRLLDPHDRFSVVAGALLTMAIFAVDVMRPVGEAIGMAYVLVIVLGLRVRWRLRRHHRRVRTHHLRQREVLRDLQVSGQRVDRAGPP
jgi:hypothetical protein